VIDPTSMYCNVHSNCLKRKDDDFWAGLDSINARGVYLVYPPLSPLEL
jgi:hypothetical protein